MKIEYYSDIHNEFRKGVTWIPFGFGQEDKSDTVLILAGDIDSRSYYLKEFINTLAMEYRHVIFVPGNHEYYHKDFDDYRNEMLNWSKGNISVLDRGHVIIDNCIFTGATLWTDFYDEPNAQFFIGKRITDFYLILKGNRKFRADDAVVEYQHTLLYFDEVLRKHADKTKIVITHFPPDISCKHPKWGEHLDDMAKYFYPSVGHELFDKADFWIYGHSHDNIIQEIEGCKILSNQIAYPNEKIEVPASKICLEI